MINNTQDKYGVAGIMSKNKHKNTALRVTLLLIAVSVIALITWQAAKPLIEYISQPERFRAWVDQHGFIGRIAFALMVILQVVIALLPGEPFEIAAGYAFGAFEGTLLFLAASTAGSILVFLLVRKFGMSLVRLFFSEEKVRSIQFLKTSRRRIILLALIFALPGTPKDLISYFAALTDISIPAWLLICSVGRIPSVITSTLGGDALGSKQYLLSVIVFLATAAISGGGLLLYEFIQRRHRKDDATMVEVTFPKEGEVRDDQLQFAVIAARYQDKWIFCRHKERNTWEIPGGHREQGESIEEAAMRELKEETGAVNANLRKIGIYAVTKERTTTYGALFLAEISELANLSQDSEIREVQLSDILPDELTYPEIQPALYYRVQSWMNLSTNADELWDVYDENRHLTGRLQRRGDALESGDYHLVVYIWIQQSDGRFLLTKRSPNKGFPNTWETTGGSALAGDDSLTAALREVKEETGLTLRPECGRCILTHKGENYFGDYWLFRQDIDLNDVVLQEGETCDKMLADEETIRAMHKDGRFVPCRHLDEVFAAAKEWK